MRAVFGEKKMDDTILLIANILTFVGSAIATVAALFKAKRRVLLFQVNAEAALVFGHYAQDIRASHFQAFDREVVGPRRNGSKRLDIFPQRGVGGSGVS